MRGVPPGTCGPSPGDGRTMRDADGLVLLMSRDTGAVAAGRVAAGGGAAVRGSRRAVGLPHGGRGEKLPPRNGETPDDPSALGRSSWPLNSLPGCSRELAERGPGRRLARRRCALEAVEKIVTALRGPP